MIQYYHNYYDPVLSQLLFLRYDYCTRLRDPPPPEPEVNDMVRELFKQLKVFRSLNAYLLCIYGAVQATQSFCLEKKMRGD